MTREEAIKVLQTEIGCVKRQDCARVSCGMCEFFLEEFEMLEAYEMAIAALREQSNATQRVANTDNALDGSNCAGCRWWGVRPQRCSCCRRNIYMKDGYEPQEVEV